MLAKNWFKSSPLHPVSAVLSNKGKHYRESKEVFWMTYGIELSRHVFLLASIVIADLKT